MDTIKKPKPFIKTGKQALATHLCCDIKELDGYQYGKHTGGNVYTANDDYYCVAKTDKNLPQPKDGEPLYKWEEVKDSWVNCDGWRIFKHTTK